MEQTHTPTPLMTAPPLDSGRAMDRADVFDAAMAAIQDAGIGFVVLDETEPMEQAA